MKFGEARARASRPLQIIHTDLCGSIEPLTWNRKKYFLTFLDYTHYTMIYFVENKNKVQDVIKEYVEHVEAHWNLRVSKIRCDNEREYLSKDIEIWCKEKGIFIDNSTSYTPQLNGKPERLNRTLLDTYELCYLIQ